jgi:hypothetical protein
MGSEFMGPGAGQGLLEALATALTAPGGMCQFSQTNPGGDIPIGVGLTNLIVKGITVPSIPATRWLLKLYCVFRIDAVLADTVVLNLNVDGLAAVEWDSVVGAGSVTCGSLATAIALVVGGGHSCNLQGQSAVGGGNATLKRLSGGGVFVSQLGTLLLPSRLV